MLLNEHCALTPRRETLGKTSKNCLNISKITSMMTKIQCSFSRSLRNQAKNAHFFLKLCLVFLESSHLKPNEIVKSSIVTLYMTFDSILKDLKVSYLAKTQICPIAFTQVPRISQL